VLKMGVAIPCIYVLYDWMIVENMCELVNVLIHNICNKLINFEIKIKGLFIGEIQDIS